MDSTGAVAVSMADGPEAALRMVEELEGLLATYHLRHAALAGLRTEEEVASY